MNRFITLLAFLACCVTALAAPAPGSRIEIKDGWYYVDGHKFFVNAIGYEAGARPANILISSASPICF